MSITHTTVAVGTDAGTGEIHKAQWNAAHTRPYPLDNYAIDGTYGDDFTGSSLSGSWTRRNFTSGDEAYQQGIDQTFIRIAPGSRSIGDGYFRTGPGGDWTIATKMTVIGAVASAFGPCVVDTNGTGVGVIGMYSNASPVGGLLVGVTTYTTYGGTYRQPGVAGNDPNVNLWPTYGTVLSRPMWYYLRKSSTSYFCAVSIDGEAWSPESASLTWSGTVDRIGMLMVPPSGSVGNANTYIYVDWFNKIA